MTDETLNIPPQSLHQQEKVQAVGRELEVELQEQRYNPDTGNFKSASGPIVKFDDAQAWVMKKL